jgi:hypothetical protein
MGMDGSFENVWRTMPPDEIAGELAPALAGLEDDRRGGERRESEQDTERLGLEQLHMDIPSNHPRGLEVQDPSQFRETTIAGDEAV